MEDNHGTWANVTADNAELYAWAIDLDLGRIILCAGYLVTVNIAGYKISDPELVLKPPLDLHMPMLAPSTDPLVLTGVYETVLRSLRSPGENLTADRVRVAVEWFAKAWHNTRILHDPERLVFLKTAFEAITGTSDSLQSARWLQERFQKLPHTTERDSKILVWSPTEKYVDRSWISHSGKHRNESMTDLETWFMEFGATRNAIVHDGALWQGEDPYFTYPGLKPVYQPVTSRSTYYGLLFFTAEFLLRGVIKVLLSELGYENAWRSELRRTIEAVCERGDA